MSKSYRHCRTAVAVITVICTVALIASQYKNQQLVFPKAKTDVPDRCLCQYNGQYINTCFTALNRTSHKPMFGHEFSCGHLPVLERLGLLDDNVPNVMASSNPPLVTAVSDNHIGEALALISSAQSHMNSTNVVVYDLGLSSENREKLLKLCRVDSVRKFPFPELTNNLFAYRWKPLIVALSLADFGSGFYYMDTSARFKSSLLTGLPAIEKITADIDSGISSPLLLLHSTGAISNHAVTHPRMFDYLPMDMAGRLIPRQHGGGILYAVRRKTTRTMLKWWVLCALTNECMSPKGSKLVCTFKNGDRAREYAGCHRYDQSAINIITLGYYNYDENTPYINATFEDVSKWMTVDRSAKGEIAPMICL